VFPCPDRGIPQVFCLFNYTGTESGYTKEAFFPVRRQGRKIDRISAPGRFLIFQKLFHTLQLHKLGAGNPHMPGILPGALFAFQSQAVTSKYRKKKPAF
jgi:hypothetical protein